MEYIKTGKKKITKDASDEHTLKGVSTSKMLWVAVRRHKFGLVATYAVVLTVFYFVPFVPGEIVNLVSSI